MNLIDEIAKRAGVSTATVSRTFRSPEKLRKETAAKILHIAGQLNYSPAPRRSRRKTRSPQTGAGISPNTHIGFLFFCEHPREIYTTNAFYRLLLHGVQSQAKLLGLSLEVELAERYSPPRVLP